MKKVLFVMGHMGLGGAAKALVNALWSLDPQKYEIDLLLFNGEGFNLAYVPPYVNYIGVITDGNRFYGRFAPLAKYLVAHGRFVSLSRRVFYAAAEVFYPHKNAASDRFFQWKFLRKYISPTAHYDVAVGYLDGMTHYFVIDKADADRKILWVHNDYSRLPVCKASIWYFKKADAVAAVSESCAREVKRFFPMLKNVCVSHNICSPQYVKSRVGTSPYNTDGFKILSIGRLCRQKAFDVAVSAAKILRSENRNFHWYIIGDGELKDELAAQINAQNLSDCFHLLGTAENPYPYINGCDAVVQCSLYEGKSLALDEAKILLKPIVCTNYNTAAEQIENGKTGLIVPQSAEGVADGVRRLMTLPHLRQSLCENLRKTDFGAEKDIKVFENILNGEK